VDPAALKAEYGKLDDASLEMHYMAAKEAVYERLQAQGGAQGAPPAPAASPSPAPPPSPAAPAPSMKNESEQGQALKKSEEKIAELQARVEKTEKLSIRALELLTAPMRKSLTGMDYQPKPGSEEKPLRKAEQMTKTEITAVLTAKSADPKLPKKDRDAINQWCLGAAELKEIQHLLEAK